jgi:exonuclease III
LRKKVSELKIYIYTRKPDLVCLSETWLKKNEPKFLGYQSLWIHRIREKGGLGILIREDVMYKPKQMIPFLAGSLECQDIEIFINFSRINILNAYNPCKNISVQELQHYTNQLGNSFPIIEDFNGHSPLWVQLHRQKS